MIMPACRLMFTCSLFKDMKQFTNELTELYIENYCHRFYECCGRYMAFRVSETEMKVMKSATENGAPVLWGA